MKKFFTSIVIGLAATFALVSMAVAAKEVTIGYQTIYNPWKVAIANGDFEKATGYKINWKKFNSGSKVINAMASGDIHIDLFMRWLERKLVPWKGK